MNNALSYLACVWAILMITSCKPDKPIGVGGDRENHEVFSLSSALTNDMKGSANAIALANNGDYWVLSNGNFDQDELLRITDQLLIEEEQALAVNSDRLNADDIIATTEGGTLIVGRIDEQGAPHTNAFVGKFNGLGTAQWTLAVDRPASNSMKRLVAAGGNFYSVGSIEGEEGTAGSTDDVLVSGFDDTGTELWTTRIEKAGDESGKAIIAKDDEGIIVLGFELGFFTRKLFVVKLDFDGEILWDKNVGEVDVASPIHVDLINANDGGFFLLSTDEVLQTDILLIKLDSEGEEEWRKIYGGVGNDTGRRMIQEENGDVLILGATASYGFGNKDVFLLKTDSEGNELWSKSYGDEFFQSSSDFVKRQNGGYMICGTTLTVDDPNGDDFNLLLIKVDEDGVPE